MDDCYWGCLWACIFGSILGLCHCAPVLLRCSAHTLLGVLSVTLSVVFDTSIQCDPDEHLDSFAYVVAVFVCTLCLWSGWRQHQFLCHGQGSVGHCWLHHPLRWGQMFRAQAIIFSLLSIMPMREKNGVGSHFRVADVRLKFCLYMNCCL